MEEAVPQTDSVTSFLGSLKQTCSREQLSKLRLTKHSLFVPEEEIEWLTELFKKWLLEHNAAKSEEKIKRRLFGTETPKLWYLIEGKACFTGYEVPLQLEPQKAQALGVPLYQGSLQDPLNFLHPRDPVLTKTDGLEASLSNLGLSLSIKKGHEQLKLPLLMLQKFAEVVRKSPMARKSGQQDLSLRDSLPLIIRLIRRAKPARHNRTILIPSKFRNSHSARFLTLGSLTVVVENNTIVSWYDLRGRSLVSFIIDELHEIIRTMPGKSLGALRLPSEERGPVSIRSGEDRFRLAVSAMPALIQAILRTRPAEGANNRSTLLECLRRAAQMIGESIWVPDYEVPKLFKKHLEEAPKVRKKDEWYFFIDKANTIRNCSGRGPIPALTKKQESQSYRSEGPRQNGGGKPRRHDQHNRGRRGRPHRGGPRRGPRPAAPPKQA